MVHERQLYEEGRLVRLGSRALDLLIALLAQAGQIVPKNELLERIWGRTVVEEAALRVHLAALRKALGDGRNGQRYITTVSGSGYGFLAPILVRSEVLPPTHVEHPPHNLPVLLTHIIGRAHALQLMARRLPQSRLLCIVGPGGIGKTTAAIALAETLLGNYADGVYFLDLASLGEPQLVPLALASALGISVSADDPLPGIISYLCKRKVLIIVDNCEHVISAAAALAYALLQRLPQIHIVATSREPLRLAGEYLLRLSPLELPPVDAMLSAGQAMQFSSVQLFVERCSLLMEDFALVDENASIVADICRKLDGLPLAIELAVARVPQLGMAELACQLEHRFRLLTRGLRNAPSRHQTLFATLDWSYALLSEHERAALRAMSMFKSAFRLDSASAVFGRDIVETLADLADKSLLVIEPGVDTVYYRLLDSTRSFAHAQLVQSEQHRAVQTRYARHCFDLSERIASDWERLPITIWSSVYGRYVDDIRAALDWSFEPDGDTTLGIGLTIVAQTLFYQLSLVDEYRVRVQRALGHMHARAIDDERSEIILRTALAHLLMHTVGVTEDMQANFERALALARRRGGVDIESEAVCGMWISNIASANFVNVEHYATQFGELVSDAGGALGLVHQRMRSSGLHLAGKHAEAMELARLVILAPTTSARLAFNSALLADRQVCMRSNLSRCLWVSGKAEQALKMAQEAVTLGHQYNGVSLCMALAFAAIPVAIWSGELILARSRVALLKEHALRFALAYWHAWGTGYELLLDCSDDALRFERLWQPSIKWPLQMNTMATMHHVIPESGSNHAAIECSPWSAPEILRRQAEQELLSSLPADIYSAEQKLLRSLVLAREQGALAWELRSAMSLSMLWRTQGRAAEAKILLRGVYRQFDEGFDTVDMRQARFLLSNTEAPAYLNGNIIAA